ncbi:hypothetical protein QF036_005063 [Arthrobacter globiformis]|nr:hypothetical protein [Arthrobacter globiformis]
MRDWKASTTVPDPRAGAGLPAGLAPPVKVALARAITKMPRAGALPGTLTFEARFDGYRRIAIRDNNGASLWSRQNKDLTRYFPELIQALETVVPPGCVVDGQTVIWTEGRLDFSARQQRLCGGPKTLPALAAVWVTLNQGPCARSINPAPLVAQTHEQRRELLRGGHTEKGSDRLQNAFGGKVGRHAAG